MKKIASAVLRGPRSRAHTCTLEVIELDLPTGVGPAAEARYIVTVRQALQESSLTAAPCTRAEAERRALDFIRRRLATGAELLRHEGLAGLDGLDGLGGPNGPTAPAPIVTTPPPNTPPVPVPAAITALVARFQPARWKLESPDRRSRAAWRVAECSDAAAPSHPAQLALRALVPRLVDLLGSGNDVLDLCLAVAIGRLGDPGALEAMQELAQRGRSPATCRAAHQAGLLLLTPEARAAQVAPLLADWALELASEKVGPELVAQVAAGLDARLSDWSFLLQAWYKLAWVQADPRRVLLRLLQALPLEPSTFQGLRYVYKAAEQRRDAEVIGLLHARFENTPALQGRAAFGPRTRDYLRLRGWRTLRRLAALSHPFAPELAVSLLLGLVDEEQPPPREEERWEASNGQYKRQTRLHHRGAGWLLLPKLLLAQLPELHTSARAKRWWTLKPLDCSRALPERSEALREMWDAHPEALLRLALESRSALVNAVVARALQDHGELLRSQHVSVLKVLLQRPYAPTAALGFEAARAHIEATRDSTVQLPWLKLLAASTQVAARDYALLHLAGDPAAFAQHADLVVALLLSAHERARKQGFGLALLAAPEPLLTELLDALLAADAADSGLAEGAVLAEQLLQGPLRQAALAWQRLGDVLPLLDHAAVPVLGLAVSWLLLHPLGVTLLPPTLLTRLLSAQEPGRRAGGARLLAALSDAVLGQQVELLCTLALSEHAGVREAISPALLRLALADEAIGRSIAARLHEALFRSETGAEGAGGEGQHDDFLRWLTGALQAFAPARDASGTWRALQARSPGAQRYGAWALAALAGPDFSLRQLATLARHAEHSVRQWAMQALDQNLPPTPTPQQAAELLPLAEASFDDARAYTQHLFGERLPDASLEVALLIAWVDHPQPWLQALGRSRLVRRMSAADASLCLTRLSQHPSTQVQLFVTQWLLELPQDDAPRLAQQLRALMPYLLSVLSQVQRGRVAKTRVIDFLRAQVAAPATAAVVAEIFARQVLTASLGDKPQYVAGLRDIAARHPQIELPFLSWKSPDLHKA